MINTAILGLYFFVGVGSTLVHNILDNGFRLYVSN
jgi:hypothetical protein